jgi:hypothetical protein
VVASAGVRRVMPERWLVVALTVAPSASTL